MIDDPSVGMPSTPSAITFFNYPADLGTSPDLQHYVLFYINVRGKSSFDKDKRSAIPEDTRQQNRITSGGSSAPAAAAAGLSGAIAGAAAGAGAVGGPSPSIAKRLGAAFAGGAIGGVLGAGSSLAVQKLSDIFTPDQTYRISDVIALHLDERPSVRYNAEYVNKDLGTIMGAVTGAFGATEMSLGGAGLEAGQEMLRQLSNIPGRLGIGGGQVGAGDILSMTSKVATNPFKEVFFENMDFRTFEFKYRFFPTSEKESRTVKNIIDKFKFHMHPELSTNKVFYIYPSEFNIVYCYKGKENTYWHKITTCALTTVDVDYGGDSFSSFHTGAPTEIYMNLKFQELEVLTKERIQEGF